MRSTFTVHHNEHIGGRSFEEVVSAFANLIALAVNATGAEA